MKKLIFIAAAAVLFATPVMAADIPTKAPAYTAPVAAPAYSWTGFYVGGNAGYGWGNANDAMTLGGFWFFGPADIRDNQALTPLGNGQLKSDGFTGGIQAGYNYQAGQWVFGIEADANYFRLKDSLNTTITAAHSYSFSSSFESDWLVTVRPRVGYAFDRFLIYATGGLAIGNQKFMQNITQTGNPPLPFSEAGSISKTTAGWTVGGGAEYALDNRWSVKAEYLYVDLGSVSFATNGFCPPSLPGADGCPPYTGTHSAHLKANIVRAGINYHFN